eukprot:gene11238-12536_t
MWSSSQLGSSSVYDTYYGAACPTDEICLLVGYNGNDGAVAYTHNRGASFNRTVLGNAVLSDVDYFEVSERSFVYLSVTVYGVVYKTTNVTTWTLAEDLGSYESPLYGVSISKSNGTAYVVGGSGLLARSSNSSSFESWTVLQSSSNLPDFYDAVSWDGKTLFIVAAQGSIYRSVDGGASLVALSSLSTSSSIYSIASISNGVLMVVGSGNFAARTTDGGNSWVAMTLPAISSKVNNPPHSLVMLSSSVGYCAGTNGKIYMTKNSGHSWEAVVSGSNPFYSLALFSNEVGAAGAGPRSGSASSGGVQPSSQPSSQPSGQPTRQPSTQPSGKPSGQPSGQPSAQPVVFPTSMPSCAPLSKPSAQPSSQPSAFPSTCPSSLPTTFPSQRPSSRPSCQPTSSPTSQPTLEPTGSPTVQPSAQPSAVPSSFPSSAPSSFIKEGVWFSLQLGTNSNSDTYYGAVCPTDEICVIVGFNNDAGAVVYTYDRGISWNRTSVGSATLGDVDYFEVSEGSFLYIAVAADALVH